MKHILIVLLFILSGWAGLYAQTDGDFPEKKEPTKRNELKFIGYYLMRLEQSNFAPTNEFLKGQVVGRLFGGNTTMTSHKRSSYSEQRFMPIITYSPRLFDGWAKMRMSFEIDWTHGDANYGAGGNFGGAYAADYVNIQTQNLFIEFHPNKRLYVNAGLLRFYDNVRVPYNTPTNELIYKGYRLALFGSDASGLGVHYTFAPNLKLKAGAYQLYENNVEQEDDVQFYELAGEYELDIINSVGLSFWYLRDRANGEGGVSILGQGLKSQLSSYNGVFKFDFGGEKYKADIFWLGSNFHGNALLNQGRWGYNGFAVANLGRAETSSRTVKINGFAGNLRVAHKYGWTVNDFVSLDGIFTTGDNNNIRDDEYSGVLTGNNWTSPGAVFFSHGLYLLLPHGNVVNRYTAAVIDIQNIGYGLTAGILCGAYDVIPNKFRVKGGLGLGMATKTIDGMGSLIGTEANLNLRYTLRVYMDLELHAAYLRLGDFYDSPVVNSGLDKRPNDPWLVFTTLKWIMF